MALSASMFTSAIAADLNPAAVTYTFPDKIEWKQGSGRNQYVTSVCTGAIILGVAGLLKGRRATTHWAFVDLLPFVGATHEKARVVQDGNVITAAGVSSGIDFAFTAAAEIAGEAAARAIQLGIEYDPAPPFDSGSPDKASPAVKSAVIAQGYDKSLSAYAARL